MLKQSFLVIANGSYQTYIPEYIYFAQTSYPNVDVLVYISENLDQNISKALGILRANGFRFEIIKYDLEDCGIRRIDAIFNSQVSRCARWVLSDEKIKAYDEIYIGDIDLLICKEKNNLFDEHRKHSIFLGLPYSDIVRPTRYIQFNATIKTMIRCGVFNTIWSYRYFKAKKYASFAETGLRYIKVKEYFEKLDPLLPRFKYLLHNYKRWGKLGFDLNPCMFSDEMFLFYMMKEAFEKVPLASSGTFNDCPNSYDFRPHHGIHLRLFSTDSITDVSSFRDLPESYSSYFKFYRAIDNEVHKQLKRYFSDFHKSEIIRLEKKIYG